MQTEKKIFTDEEILKFLNNIKDIIESQKELNHIINKRLKNLDKFNNLESNWIASTKNEIFRKEDGISYNVELILYTTINNSSYIVASYGSTFIGDSSSSQVFSESCCDTIFDVTDTSQCKCKFGMVVVGGDSITLRAESAANVSYVMFTRLGDT